MGTEHTPYESADLLRAIDGDTDALRAVLPLLQDRAREIATQVLHRDRARKWVGASSLVQLAMIRLLDQREVDVEDRARVTAVLATIMRRIVIDIARKQTAERRGGESPHVSLQSWHGPEPDSGASARIDALEIDDSLVSLAAADPEAARIAEMRLWGGMDLVGISVATGMPLSRTRAHWHRAQAWLARDLAGGR